MGLIIFWGTTGFSIRVRTSDRPEPLSIGWVFPPGVSGWMGLTDQTLGFDESSAQHTPSIAPALAEYVNVVGELPGAVPTTVVSLSAFTFSCEALIENNAAIKEIVASLVHAVSE